MRPTLRPRPDVLPRPARAEQGGSAHYAVDVVDVPALPAVRIDRATPEDHAGIAELTVSVYVGGGLAGGDYATELADVAGRRGLAGLFA